MAQQLENYESQSPILLKNIKGSHLVFENNTFDSNIGMHGGSIHIDFQQKNLNLTKITELSPYILLKNNSFARNMAYFEGNSVFIRGAQNASFINQTSSLLHVLIEKCTFTKNYGLNVGKGAALVIDGKQSDEVMSAVRTSMSAYLNSFDT